MVLLLRLKTDRLIEYRIKAGLSQRSLAKRSGLSSAYVSQLESGNRTPSPKVAKLLCESLGVQFDELFEIRKRPEEATA